eukprot:6978787-Alexandrium_andersonii.AAC.1
MPPAVGHAEPEAQEQAQLAQGPRRSDHRGPWRAAAPPEGQGRPRNVCAVLAPIARSPTVRH